MIKDVKFAVKIASSPEKIFSEIHKKTFDGALYFYVKMLIFSALAAAVWSFVFSMLKAAYYQAFLNAGVQYLRLMNYSLGKSVSISFLFVFAGTFLLFPIASMFKPFFRDIPYLDYLKIVIYSTAPILLFGWISFSLIPLFIWVLFIFFVGVKSYKADFSKKGTIRQRD